MTRRPSEFAIGWWIVFGASIASIGTAVTGFEHRNSVALIGIGNPVIRALVLWALAVGAQAAVWAVWAVIRKPPQR